MPPIARNIITKIKSVHLDEHVALTDEHSSKIHLAVNANENPIKFIMGDKSTHDAKVAPDLIDALNLEETEILCANKG